MSVEADAVCGAEYGARSTEREYKIRYAVRHRRRSTTARRRQRRAAPPPAGRDRPRWASDRR
jgi:hypothetical protein